MNRLKNWKWDSFWFILILCAIGLGSNRTVDSFAEFLLGMLVFGIPAGLLFAYMGRDENE